MTTPDELQGEIAQRRADLATSVDALTRKLDVRDKVKARVVALRVPLAVGAAALVALVVVRKVRS